MAATGRTDRNAVDQLLFKMMGSNELRRVKRGVYALAGTDGKKEIARPQTPKNPQENGVLIDLTDLTRVGAGDLRQ
jgi:hypothetical protein